MQNSITKLEQELRSKYMFDNIVGSHPRMVKVLEFVSQIANSKATVLIQGETGTGKELIARAIHYNSSRREKPFVPVNCSALPENLLESELFGHVRGAFTGAVSDKIGWFEQAEGGTIFLDEVSEMSHSLQKKVLRVLQSGEFSKVGDTQIKCCNVRIVSATNKKLLDLVKKGRFREDLFYRLDVIEIDVPPLRERKSDIPLLVRHFIELYNQENHKNIFSISPQAVTRLMAYDYPGNVRELQNIIEQAMTLAEGDRIEIQHLPKRLSCKREADLRSGPKTLTAIKRSAANKAEKEFVIDCLQASGGHITNAAKIAGIDAGNFYRIIKKHGINPADFKKAKK